MQFQLSITTPSRTSVCKGWMKLFYGIFSYFFKIQYCQNRNINILNRVCRELTRLSRSKHTLVNILTIDLSQYSDYAILVLFISISKIILVMVKSIVKILTKVCLDLLILINSLHTLFKILIFRFWQYWKIF